MGPQSGAEGVQTMNRWERVVWQYFGAVQTGDRRAVWSRRAERKAETAGMSGWGRESVTFT